MMKTVALTVDEEDFYLEVEMDGEVSSDEESIWKKTQKDTRKLKVSNLSGNDDRFQLIFV